MGGSKRSHRCHQILCYGPLPRPPSVGGARALARRYKVGYVLRRYFDYFPLRWFPMGEWRAVEKVNPEVKLQEERYARARVLHRSRSIRRWGRSR